MSEIGKPELAKIFFTYNRGLKRFIISDVSENSLSFDVSPLDWKDQLQPFDLRKLERVRVDQMIKVFLHKYHAPFLYFSEIHIGFDYVELVYNHPDDKFYKEANDE